MSWRALHTVYTARLTALLLALWVLSPSAWGHAVLVRSIPAANATIDGGATAIVLTYNSRIDAAHSSLTLVTPQGKEERLSAEPQSAPNELRAHASGLRPGAYTLRWQVLAADGHITRGVVSFAVR